MAVGHTFAILTHKPSIDINMKKIFHRPAFSAFVSTFQPANQVNFDFQIKIHIKQPEFALGLLRV